VTGPDKGGRLRAAIWAFGITAPFWFVVWLLTRYFESCS
jgi:hypothetical protein